MSRNHSRTMSVAALCGTALAAFIIPAAVVAQTPAAEQAAPADPPTTPVQPTTGPAEAAPEVQAAADIVVTARRRAEELSKVPAVVAAFSGAQLERQNITQQTDLQAAVPGLIVRQTESNNNLNYVIRGQSVDAFTGSATAVVPYVNEVQFAPGGLSSFFDLQSLQVLKGPQGTLFGRNATGGAVLLTTAKPVNELTGSIQMEAGNFGLLNPQGVINVPIVSDKILLRAAFDVYHRRGFMYNLFNGQHPGAFDRQTGRISLTIRPTDTIQNDTVVQIEHSGGSNASSVLYSINKCGQLDPSGVPLNCSADFLFGPQLDANIGFPGAWAIYLAAHPGANPGGIEAALAAQKKLGFWRVDEYTRTDHDAHNAFVTNTTTFALGDDLQLKNIFGASRSHTEDLAAEIGAPFLILSTYNALLGPPKLGTNSNDERNNSISEELQLQGKALDNHLNYTLGGYYAHTRQVFFYPATYTDLSPVIPLIPDVFTSISHFRQKDSQEALYAHLSYDLGGVGLSGFTADAGFRYTWEHQTSVQLDGSRFLGSPPLAVSFDKPSWNAGIDYQATPSLLLYAQTRGSWRAGGINGIARPLEAPPSEGGSLYLAETTHDVEVGAKFGGRVADLPAHLYLALYRQEIKNIQRAQLLNVPVSEGVTQPLNLTINVPSARVQGAEFDAGIKLAPWLEIGAVGAYTDAKYRDNALVAFGQTYLFGPYGDVPKFSGTLNAQVTAPLGGGHGELLLRGEVYAQSRFYFSNTAATRTPGTRVPGYALVNGRLDWSDFMGRKGLTASLFVRNLLNRGYYTGGFGLGDLLGVNSASVGEPRMWGGQLKYSF